MVVGLKVGVLVDFMVVGNQGCGLCWSHCVRAQGGGSGLAYGGGKSAILVGLMIIFRLKASAPTGVLVVKLKAEALVGLIAQGLSVLIGLMVIRVKATAQTGLIVVGLKFAALLELMVVGPLVSSARAQQAHRLQLHHNELNHCRRLEPDNNKFNSSNELNNRRFDTTRGYANVSCANSDWDIATVEMNKLSLNKSRSGFKNAGRVVTRYLDGDGAQCVGAN
jgi:hypothetical protein